MSSSPSSGPPPPTNRGAVNTSPPASNHLLDGSNPLTVSLHWLTATSLETSAVDAAAFLSDYLDHMPEHRESGQMGYTETYAWAGGLKLYDNPKRPEMGVCMVASGDACEYYGFDRLSHVYQSLQLKATRVDIAVDECPFEPELLRKHWYRDEVRTVCKPQVNAQPDRAHLRTHNWVSSPDGDTFYMGSRSSTQFARCYNSRGFTRFEMELKKERAVQVMELLNGGVPMAQVAGSVIDQFVAFVKLDDTNRARCTLQRFWARFLNMLDDAGVRTRLDPLPDATIGRTIDWIEGQVAASLYVYETVMGARDDYEGVRRNLRRIGLEACTGKHKALIEAGGGWLGYASS